METIKFEKNIIKIAKDLLGTDEAYIWVGYGFSPTDNDDMRVNETRDLMQKYYKCVPYGMFIGNTPISGENVVPIRDNNEDGYYDIDVSWWPEGMYRFNLHTKVNESSPAGSQLQNGRDKNVSWLDIMKGWEKANDKNTAMQFISKDKNGEGYSFRVVILPDRTILPCGDKMNRDTLKKYL